MCAIASYTPDSSLIVPGITCVCLCPYHFTPARLGLVFAFAALPLPRRLPDRSGLLCSPSAAVCPAAFAILPFRNAFASATLASGSQRKLQPPLLPVDAVQQHMHPLPHLEHPPRPRTHNLLVRITKHKPLVAAPPAQRRNRHQPSINKIVQFHKEPILRARQDNPAKVLADAVLHKPHLFPLHQFALGVVRAPLRLA